LPDLLERARAATTDLTALLDDAHAAAAPRSAPAPRRRRSPAPPTRTPVKLPGGVRADTIEATEHLMRSGALVLVDGYNVAKLGWPAFDLEHQRSACVSLAEDVARRWSTAITVVFDGADVPGASAPRRRLVRVQYSPAGVLADDVLREEVDRLDVERAVVVVTNDQAVVADVRAAGASIVSSDQFLQVARR
jgi:predicted RNA-binding protein with PIN domain